MHGTSPCSALSQSEFLMCSNHDMRIRSCCHAQQQDFRNLETGVTVGQWTSKRTFGKTTAHAVSTSVDFGGSNGEEHGKAGTGAGKSEAVCRRRRIPAQPPGP